MSIWSDLVFSAGHSARSIVGGVGYSWLNGNGPIGDLKFKSKPASKIVTARVAQQIAMQMAEAEINKLFPRLQRQLERNLRKTVLEQTKDNNYAKLIQHGQDVTTEYGCVYTTEGQPIVARDYLTRRVPEALILSYVGDKDITYSFPPSIKAESYTIKKQAFLQQLLSNSHTIQHDIQYEYGDETFDGQTDNITTKDVIHIDLSAQVSLSTNKNLVLTPVQGRDFTRKELIAGGDLTFSVNGSIASNTPGLYPEAAVQRLIKIAQYKGVVNVHHFIFDQFKVKQIIIKDFNLGTQEFKNIQPYSFTCVAIEADEIQVKNDTIGAINQEIQLSPMNAWYRLILNNKLAEIAAGAVANTANSALSKGLDIEGMVTNV